MIFDYHLSIFICDKLWQIDQNLKLGKIEDINLAIIQKVEILSALKKLNEKLTDEEKEFLTANMNNNMKQFEVASSNIGKFNFRVKHFCLTCN